MLKYLCGFPLGKACTFSTGGRAGFFAYAYSPDDLIEAEREGAAVIGRGSNVLFGDAGYRGKIVVNRFGGASFTATECVCSSGTGISELASAYLKEGRTGLEWAYGLPGTVGGAIAGNAGAFGGCAADVVKSVTVCVGGKLIKLSARECGFGYRKSSVPGVIVEATLRAEAGDGRERSLLNLEARKKSQPHGASAGCIFRTEGESAGKLIDEAGLKGLRVGGAEISDKHAGFIINTGGASSHDILTLINICEAEVYSRFGKKLKREIKLLGDFY